VHWHIITGEYPPQLGGVSDYTRLVARELARAGDRVDVWTSEYGSGQTEVDGVGIHRLPGCFGPSALAILDRAIAADRRHRILVQYVPHAFGWKAMNLAFCSWLFARRRRQITVIFHEVAFPKNPSHPFRYRLLGTITSLMARLTASSASRIYISSSSWENLLRPIAREDQPIRWLPVPSNVPVVGDLAAICAIRSRYAPIGLLVGHLGTYSRSIREYLEAVLPILLEEPAVSTILLGYGSAAFRDELVKRNPAIRDKIYAMNALSSEALSLHLSACDLMVQPYPDGISTRRTSAMAALAHRRPIVTTQGALTETLWVDSGAVATAPAEDPLLLARIASDLLRDDLERERLGRLGSELYDSRFDLRHTIAQLRTS
jgi:glycosyltransferase involved in cell wall biosynthesis